MKYTFLFLMLFTSTPAMAHGDYHVTPNHVKIADYLCRDFGGYLHVVVWHHGNPGMNVKCKESGFKMNEAQVTALIKSNKLKGNWRDK